MSPVIILAWSEVARVLLSTGVTTWNTIRGWIRSTSPEATDAELNAILDGALELIRRKRAEAQQDLDAVIAKIEAEKAAG